MRSLRARRARVPRLLLGRNVIGSQMKAPAGWCGPISPLPAHVSKWIAVPAARAFRAAAAISGRRAPAHPPLPWSATRSDPPLAADIPPPQEIYEGSYEMTSDCPEQGCAYGAARFAANTPLYARQDTRAPIVATIPVGECALKTGRDALLSAPQRGVVLETSGQFVAGDVIYRTSYDGEGYSTVWRRGEYLSDFQDDVVVQWDEGPRDPREGYWVEVTRANGQAGWALDPDISERDCTFARRHAPNH